MRYYSAEIIHAVHDIATGADRLIESRRYQSHTYRVRKTRTSGCSLRWGWPIVIAQSPDRNRKRPEAEGVDHKSHDCDQEACVAEGVQAGRFGVGEAQDYSQ